MKEIKLRVVDWWDEETEENFNDNFVVQILSKRYKVIYSDQPDYVIFGPFGFKHLQYKNAIMIFVSGENARADWDVADYAIDYDYIDFLDRHFRYPLAFWNYSFCDVESIKNRGNKTICADKKFCSYIVTAASLYSPRDEFFKKLCNYKKVDSGGRHLNNIGGPIGDRYNNFTKSKIEWLKGYKFNICFENSYHPGYITEKLFQAFAGGCIPIYWGDPLVSNVVNPKSFINISDFSNFDEAIEYIKEVDNDDKLFESIMQENVFLQDIDYVDYYNKELEKYLYYIFDQELDKAKRIFGSYKFIAKMSDLHEMSFRSYWRHSKLRARLRKFKKQLKGK